MTFGDFKLILVGVLKAWFPNKNSLDKLSDNNGIGSYNNKKITISENEDNLLTEDETGILLSQDNISFNENVSSNPSNNTSDGNPVCTIISFYGLTAPDGYLVCDGSPYNRKDYPNLSLHLTTNFEDLVGDGSTTFTVPDLRGEFIRGSGTNSHTNQGDGGAVGEHQDGTKTIAVDMQVTDALTTLNGVGDTYISDYDYIQYRNGYRNYYSRSSYQSNQSNYPGLVTSRPTNTSMLLCIKY